MSRNRLVVLLVGAASGAGALRAVRQQVRSARALEQMQAASEHLDAQADLRHESLDAAAGRLLERLATGEPQLRTSTSSARRAPSGRVSATAAAAALVAAAGSRLCSHRGAHAVLTITA